MTLLDFFPQLLEFKLFFQELCRMKIGWDDPLNDELLKMWGKLLDGLEGVTALSLSRCYFQGVQERVVSCSLHGFGDASSKAYAAVIYLHLTTTTGSYVKFVDRIQVQSCPCERIIHSKIRAPSRSSIS